MAGDHYQQLGVSRSATSAQIRAAYRRMARAHHPDRPSGDAQRMQAINAAFAVLGDERRRRAYDLTLGPASARPGSGSSPPSAGAAGPHAHRPSAAAPAPPGGYRRTEGSTSAAPRSASAAATVRPSPPGTRPYRGGSSRMVRAVRSRQAGTVASVLSVAPVVMFATALFAGLAGMMLTSRVLLGGAFLLFSLAVLTMITAALVELVRSSSGAGGRRG